MGRRISKSSRVEKARIRREDNEGVCTRIQKSSKG